MTNPKPCEMWAVYDGEGNVSVVRHNEGDAKLHLVKAFSVGSWDTVESYGFTIHRVTVTPIVEGEV